MELSVSIRDLPGEGATTNALLGALVVLFSVSSALGVVSAGIAIGVEFGSLLLGAVAAVLGLVLLFGPVAAFLLLSGGGDDATPEADRRDAAGDRYDGPVGDLRERYLAGEIDEETFELKMDELLDADDRDATAAGLDPADGVDDEVDRTAERG